VTESTQPFSATPAETLEAPRARSGVSHSTTFPELVYAHFDWWRGLRDNGARRSAKTAYHQALADFESHNGQIVSAYWCSHVESAVALTHKRRRLPWASPVSNFYRESDWATQNSPDIARELHRCDELAVRARTVLTGVRRLICMQLVMASAAHILSLVDARASHADAAKSGDALRQERDALTRAEASYCDAANGQAQIVYFVGMAAIAVALSAGAAVWLAIDWASPVAALVAGALGAVVSVIQRINAGKFTLDYDVGRPYALFLGGVRPLIGGAFAIAISFAFTGGLLHLPIAATESSGDRRLALLVVSFLAGFSERWAQDTLATAVPAASASEPQPPPASSGQPR
jgi:hypothetical protein